MQGAAYTWDASSFDLQLEQQNNGEAVVRPET